MRHLLIPALLAACLAAGALPANAAAPGEMPTDPGCTINPFDHTWRCIDFSKCRKGADGSPTTDCPITTGTYLQGAARATA